MHSELKGEYVGTLLYSYASDLLLVYNMHMSRNNIKQI